jgi:hypothetical protein
LKQGKKGADIELDEMCSLAYEFLRFGTFHTSGEERFGFNVNRKHAENVWL